MADAHPLQKPAMPRITSLDMLRGIVLLLMVQDHVRDTLGYMATAVLPDVAATMLHPANLALTSPSMFLLRFLAHLVAPGFIFLAGISVFLWGLRRGPEASIHRYLFTRGLMIAGLNFLLFFHAPFSGQGYFTLHVLWPIGIGMVLLGLIIKAPRPLLWCLALVLICGQNVFETIHLGSGWPGTLWTLFFRSESLTLPWGDRVDVLWQIGPWFAVLLLGYLIGPIFLHKDRGCGVLLRTGLACIGLFILLRSSGIYGDSSLWHSHDLLWQTVASFFNVTKYPASLQFFLITFGIICYMLVALEKTGYVHGFVLTLGGAPLFFYVAHILLLKASRWLWPFLPEAFLAPIYGWLFSASGVLVFSALVALALYPFCKQYRQFCAAKRKGLLSEQPEKA